MSQEISEVLDEELETDELTVSKKRGKLKHRQYRRVNCGVMTSDRIVAQVEKVAEEKEEAEAAKIDRKNDREEKKRQREVLLNVKNEKNEERKAKKQRAEEDRKLKKDPPNDVPDKVPAKKRGRPPGKQKQKT